MRNRIVVSAAVVAFVVLLNMHCALAQTTQPSTQPATQPTAAEGEHAEKVLVFIGTFRKDDGSIVGFVENLETKSIDTVHVGDKIARGRISSITLEKLEYQVGDDKSELTIGQNLAGQTVSRPNPPRPLRQPATGPGPSL
jgi:hypothetical protein